MSSPVRSFENIDLSKVVISKFNPATNGRKMGVANIRSTDSTSRRFCFTTPTQMRAPFGASTFDSESQHPKYNLSLSLDPDSEPKIKFTDFLERLDQRICEEVAKNKDCLRALGIKANKENENMLVTMVKAKYGGPLVKIDMSEKYPPLFPTKLYRNPATKAIETICRTDDKITQISDDNVTMILEKGCKVRCIVQIAYLWFVSGRFGATPQILKCEVEQPSEVPIAQLSFPQEKE